MPVVCSSCPQDGKPGVIRLKEPLADRRRSHGIFLIHRRKLEVALGARLTSATPAEGRLVTGSVRQACLQRLVETQSANRAASGVP